jgi:hypothetical protein
LRWDHYKYVYSPGGVDELYDLSADPYELQNRVDDADLNSVRSECRRRLLEWMELQRDGILAVSRQLLSD